MSDWERSSFCGNTTCVEVSRPPGGPVRVRDSKHPLQQPLTFDAEEWAEFLRGVRAGQFGPADARMTPEEHYGYGQSLLKSAESLFEVDHPAAASQAAMAHGHFTAAAAGSAMRAMEIATHPQQVVSPQIYVGDTVDYVMPAIGPGTEPRGATGTVVRVHTDGFITAEFEQADGLQPMTVIAPAEAFTLVRTTRGGSDG